MTPTPGASAMLAALPDTAKAIVSSAGRDVAAAWIAAAGISAPPTVITAADVTRGTPDPEPFLLAARRLGIDPRRCIVVEDAPAGVSRGTRRGVAKVLAVGGTYGPEHLDADLYVESLDSLRITLRGKGFGLAPSGTGTDAEPVGS